MQEERDRRHTQKQRDKDGKSLRFQPPPSHSDFSSTSNSSLSSFQSLLVFPSVAESEPSHHESRHASDDPNTTNLFINTIPRSVCHSYLRFSSIDFSMI